jgi:hypothetical protein
VCRDINVLTENLAVLFVCSRGDCKNMHERIWMKVIGVYMRFAEFFLFCLEEAIPKRGLEARRDSTGFSEG